MRKMKGNILLAALLAAALFCAWAGAASADEVFTKDIRIAGENLTLSREGKDIVQGVDYIIGDDRVTSQSGYTVYVAQLGILGDNITISSQKKLQYTYIVLSGNITVTFKDLCIDLSNTGSAKMHSDGQVWLNPGMAPVSLVNIKGLYESDVTIVLEGYNELKGGVGRAGLEKDDLGSLTIKKSGQSGEHKLVAVGGWGGAGIGGRDGASGTFNADAGNITILGGVIEATGGDTGGVIGGGISASGAGIGGGGGGSAAQITIGGDAVVTATGKGTGAGIGGGMNGRAQSITIAENANVTAKGDWGGAGIGNGSNGGQRASQITIEDSAKVNATGTGGGAGIGGGLGSAAEKIRITGGNVTAKSEMASQAGYASVGGGAGIGGGRYSPEGHYTQTVTQSIAITGGTVHAEARNGGAGIGGGSMEGSTLPITNSAMDIEIGQTANVTAISHDNGAGIGGGYYGLISGTKAITIRDGAVVRASSATGGAGIGGGDCGDGYSGRDCSGIHIGLSETGSVTATGGGGGAGIGGGRGSGVSSGYSSDKPKDGAIIIEGGEITATGSSGGAGIGAGAYGDVKEQIKLTKIKKLTATGGSGGAGVGAGIYGDVTSEGEIRIEEVITGAAVGDLGGAGVGAGRGGGENGKPGGAMNGLIRLWKANSFTATGAGGGAGIGAGYLGKCVAFDKTNQKGVLFDDLGTVTANGSSAPRDTVNPLSEAVGHGAGVAAEGGKRAALNGDFVLILNGSGESVDPQRGILVAKDVGTVYGPVTLPSNLVLPSSVTLLVGKAEDLIDEDGNVTPGTATQAALTIPKGVTLLLEGKLAVGDQGTVTVKQNGELSCGPASELEGEIRVSSEGLLTNWGDFVVKKDGKLLIEGTLDNKEYASVTGGADSKIRAVGSEGAKATITNGGKMIMEEKSHDIIDKGLTIENIVNYEPDFIFLINQYVDFTDSIIWNALLAVTATTPGDTAEAGTDYKKDGNVLTILTNKPMTITGNTISEHIVVSSQSGAALTLDNLVVNASVQPMVDQTYYMTGVAALLIDENTGAVTIDLVGQNNALTGGVDSAGLQKDSTASLTIRGGGALTAQGGANGAGIGGGYRATTDSEKITIEGSVTITATGGNGGAGIGGARSHSAKTLTVQGNAKVTATGGNGAAGIGGGLYGSAETIAIQGDAVVSAEGGSGAAGIGRGGLNPKNNEGTDSNISIQDNAYVTATGGAGASAVGKGELKGEGAVLIAVSDSSTVTDLAKTHGLCVENGRGEVYGKVTLAWNLEIEAGWMLYVLNADENQVDKQLIVPPNVTVTNDGAVYAFPGDVADLTTPNDQGAIVVQEDGQWKGNPPIFQKVVGVNVGDFIVQIASDAVAAEVYEYAGGVLTVKNGAVITIANVDPETATTNGIAVEANASVEITLAGVNIETFWSSNSDYPPLQIDAENGKSSTGVVTIILKEGSKNRLIRNFGTCAALQKHDGEGKLIIKGKGELYAYRAQSSAAIGGSWKHAASNIYIQGGNITAKASGGAAIGGGEGATDPSTIFIEGGTVNARSYSGAAIGSGFNGGCGKVTITGGKVIANNAEGAGIGGGHGAHGEVVIEGGDVTSQASAGAGIGSGDQAPTGESSSVSISGGTVDVSGWQGIGNGEPYQENPTTPGPCAITITGGSVTARGKNRALESAPTLDENLAAEASESKDGAPPLKRYAAADNDQYKYVRIQGGGSAIQQVEVTGVVQPVVGEVASWYNEAANSGYTAYATEWTPDDYTFGYGTSYTARVTVKAELPGFFDAGTTGTINGKAATPALNPDGTLTLTYTFPPTAAAPMTGPDFEGAIAGILAAPEGGTVTLDLRGGYSVLPGRVLDALAGKNVTLIVLLDGGIRWEINGLNVESGLGDVDLGALLGGKNIPQEAVEALAGSGQTLQLHLSHDGPYGFTARLVLPVQSKFGGLWALLYRWEDGQLSYKDSSRVKKGEKNASVEFVLDHASDYLIVFSEEAPQAPRIRTASLEEGVEGERYRQELKARGLVNEWTLAEGKLPEGLKLKEGVIEGTPARAGRYVLRIRAAGAMGEDEKRLVLVIRPGTVELNAGYLLLSAGESAQLRLAEDKYAELAVSWRAEGDEGVIEVDASGVVKAVKRGLGYAVASVELGGGSRLEGRCRVDVIEGSAAEEAGRAVLGQESVNVKLYARERARVRVSLELQQNAMAKSAQGPGAIESARFSEEGAARAFDLRVVDDGTLEIEPRAEAEEGKGSYQTKIVLTLKGGGERETEKKLKVKVDKALPKVTGKLAFNSFYREPEAELKLEGGQVQAVEVIACPAGVSFDAQTMSARLTGTVKKKETLKLKVRLEGWTRAVEASIPVEVKESEPEIGLSPQTLALDQSGSVGLETREQVTGVRVAAWDELSAKQRKKYKLNGAEYGFAAALENGRIKISAAQAGTGKLLLEAEVEGGKEAVALVLGVKASGEGKLTVKAKDQIDLLRPDSAVTLTPSVGSWERAQVSVTARDKKKKGEKGDLGDQSELFEVEEINGRLLVRRAAGAKLNPQYAYTAQVTLTTQGGELKSEAAIAVKKGKATAQLSEKTVTLFTTDRYSEAIVEVSFKDKSLSAIEKVTSASKKFALKYLGGGRCAISFKEGKAPKKGETMKLNIFLEGYDKAATTAKVKVKLAD